MRKVSILLKEKRKEKKFSLEQVEKATKIKKEFLEFIEKGDFHKLPSESYALGFVKNYASFLGLPTNSIAALFRREYKAEAFSVVPEFRKTQNKFNKSIFSKPKTVIAFLIGLIIIGYTILQYSSLIFPPKLIIETPQENQVVSENVIEVKGVTNQYNTVFVNGEEAYVSLDGDFRKSIYVFSGDQKINIAAENRFGKRTEKVIFIKVK